MLFMSSESERLEASNVVLENYRLKSGEGLSVGFVVVWLLGDIFGLLGGWLAGLLPTIIILTAYYTVCDTILLFQIYYYRWTHPVHPASLIIPRAPPNPADPNSTADEHSPLLRDQPPNNSASCKTVERDAHDTLARRTLRYALLFGFVIGTGVVAWGINRLVHPKDGTGRVPPGEHEIIEWKSQLLGYASAICFIGARIPQILKNQETKCEGLSLALFMFTISGNLTYVLSICVASMSKQHLLANASWLAGSGLAMFFDFFILFQFYCYQNARVTLETPHLSPLELAPILRLASVRGRWIRIHRRIPNDDQQLRHSRHTLTPYAAGPRCVSWLEVTRQLLLFATSPSLMIPHFATFANVCVQLYNLWLSILPAATAAVFVYSLAHCCSSLWAPPPTLVPHRGRQHATAHAPVREPFHPGAPRVQSAPSLRLILWIIVIKPTIDLAWLTINAVTLFVEVNYTFFRPNLGTYVAPIRIRIQQGIAQVPTIPNALALSDVSYRYICPVFFLAALLAVLVPIAGLSVKLACLVCFVGWATAVAGDRMGVVEEEEDVSLGSDPGPQVGAGLVAALHEQT
ncbi:hypothetical protein FRC10_012221 [Ceratobasidium sp. 414]|nr:hypothetical protein FRC10_012221 [Ceratobasidium sp. 414]